MSEQLYRKLCEAPTCLHSHDCSELIPVEPDPAMLQEDIANECAIETVLRGGANHCVRPDGHEGMHLAFTYWGTEIGDTE